MTELFARVPLWLALDGGVRSLPAAARVALYDVAVAGGTIRCGAAPSGALEALCAGAGEHLDLLLDRGLIEIDGGRLSLVSPDGALWEGRSTQTSTADAPRALAAPIEASARRSIVKALGARWSEKGLATAESRLAWIDSGVGAEYLRAHGVDVETAREIARGAGQRRGVFGRDRSPITRGVSTGVSESGGPVSRTGVSRDTGSGVSTGVSGLSPSHSPSEKESRNEGIPERATGVSESGVSRDTGSGVSTGVSVSRSSGVTARETDPLTALSEASGGGVSGIAAAHVRMELVTFAASNRLTLADFEAVGRLLATPEGRKKAWPWMTSARRSVDVGFLRDREGAWSRLSDALELVRAETSTAKRPSSPPAAPKPKRAPLKPLTPEQRAALLGETAAPEAT